MQRQGRLDPHFRADDISTSRAMAARTCRNPAQRPRPESLRHESSRPGKTFALLFDNTSVEKVVPIKALLAANRSSGINTSPSAGWGDQSLWTAAHHPSHRRFDLLLYQLTALSSAVFEDAAQPRANTMGFFHVSRSSRPSRFPPAPACGHHPCCTRGCAAPHRRRSGHGPSCEVATFRLEPPAQRA